MKTLFAFLTFLLLLCSCSTTKVEDSTPSTATNAANALEHYLANGDDAYQWSIKETYALGAVSANVVRMVSQHWHGHTWVHQLTILVPPEVDYDGALLFITGKGIKNGEPQWRSHDDDLTKALSQMAIKNKAVITILWQTPNQPLYDDLTEDALISYTLHQFKNDGDYTWPLLFPMVKSAVRAMDATQEFGQQRLQKDITRFVVTGASKRGWTTWLTGSQDDRVAAIAPMVIDVLNMPVNLNYQKEAWGDWSVEIQDYVDLGIVQDMESGKGQDITRMIDPYGYRATLTMPKLLLIGTNDPYWPVDAVKHYFNNIPGENYIHYVPNAGHGLNGGEQALRAISAFWGRTLRFEKYPTVKWNLHQDKMGIALKVVSTPDQLQGYTLWMAASEDRDFRDNTFTPTHIDKSFSGYIEEKIEFPMSGYKAFYIDSEYTDPNGGKYTKSTRMFVADNDEVFVE